MSVASLIHNRNLMGLLLANAILGAAFPMQLILGGLTGLMLAPSPGLATLPSSIQTLAALFAAAPLSLLMGRFGRRTGFVLGGLLTLAGAVAATQAVYAQSFPLLCLAHFLMGAGWSSFQYFRFAAAEAVDVNWRPVAISLMLSSLLIAALVGPQVFILAKDALAPIPFAGAYVATGLIGLAGLFPLAIVRMPVPKPPSRQERGNKFATLTASLRIPTVRQAIGIAAVSQGVMVFLMVPTPIAMVFCGFSEATASDVVRWHIVAMFAPSFFTGFLIKRFGAQTIATAGLTIFVVSAGAAALGISAVNFYGALIILGIGWNFGFIGATTMLEAAVSEEDKAVVQGANDTAIALVSAVCAFSSGLVLGAFGWTTLALFSIGIVLATIAMSRVKAARTPTFHP